MKPPQIETRKITDFTPDPSNANKGTERGLRILDNSIGEVGLGRSAVADKNGILIAGNKTQERSVDSGFEDAIVVHTTGKQFVIVQRDDLDLLDNDPNNPARRMAYYDNVTSQHMAWDAAQIAADVEAGVNLDAMFTPDELAALTDYGVFIPDAMDKQEPEIKGEVLIEIYCTKEQLKLFEPSLNEWRGIPDVTINVS